jgi:hypothetical protein
MWSEFLETSRHRAPLSAGVFKSDTQVSNIVLRENSLNPIVAFMVRTRWASTMFFLIRVRSLGEHILLYILVEIDRGMVVFLDSRHDLQIRREVY